MLKKINETTSQAGFIKYKLYYRETDIDSFFRAALNRESADGTFFLPERL
jgi:hypothetical protein